MKRDTRIPDEAGMTDRETIIKGLEWWAKHQEGEVLPLAYSAVVETLKVLKEQDELLHKKQNDIDRLCNEISEWKHKFHDRPLKEQESVAPIPLYMCADCLCRVCARNECGDNYAKDVDNDCLGCNGCSGTVDLLEDCPKEAFVPDEE